VDKDRDRHEKQCNTFPVTVEWIMSRPEFTLGFAHVRNGKKFDTWAGCGHSKKTDRRSAAGRAWDYERGRIFACLAPRNMPLRLADGRLNPEAVKLCNRAFDLGYIL
jgi:hypothetical protein